ncbi:MAG: class III signal peptide-containing protein [Olsenella sp.]|nr:class III signal peptide-containing protein [Olsenella sp.]
MGRLRRGLIALRDTVGARVAAGRGQGTTEYAILVGVLVVIAILAIVSFRGKVQELWDAISSGIGSL